MRDDERSRLHEELARASGPTADPFASAVRTTRMPMVITDPRQPDNPIIFCNDAFCAMTLYGRDEILGRNCRFLQGAATRQADVAVVREGIRRREAVQCDLLNYRRDGTTFWNALLVSPVFDRGELTFFFASQLDVTDRKRAEEHRFLLNRELDHRVKNTLATVQSVVLQTLRDASVPETVASTVAGRLQALSRSHDVLTAEAWASADMGDVIRSALGPLRERAGGRIAVEGPAVRIKPRIATMLSLAMHELGDNARRYGALSASGGRVGVVWEVRDGHLRLRWTETGGPRVEPPAHSGYGTRIVRSVMAAEFGGTAELDFRSDGLRFALDAPAGAIGEEATRWGMEEGTASQSP